MSWATAVLTMDVVALQTIARVGGARLGSGGQVAEAGPVSRNSRVSQAT